MTPNTKKIIITFAKRLKNSTGYEYTQNINYYNKFYGSLSTSISKTIINSFDDKIIFLINLLSSRLNSSESPEKTLDFILKKLKIFVVVHFSEVQNTIGCLCEDGYNECGVCDGAGSLKCDTCNGTGDQIDEETEEEIDCEECMGSGQIACGNCEGDSLVVCNECSGYGYLTTDEYTDISVSGYFSMLQRLNDGLTKQGLNYNDEDNVDVFDFVVELNKSISNKNFNVGNIRMNVEDFTLRYYDYEDAINFDIDEKYYDNSYVIGAYDLFDPNLILTLKNSIFYIHINNGVINVLKNNFCK